MSCLTPIHDPPLTEPQRELVAAYLRQWRPLAVAKRLFRSHYRGLVAMGVADEDIAAEFAAGVCKAARTFDPGRGVAFNTFAHWKVKGHLSGLLAGLTAAKRRPPVPAVHPDAADGDAPDALAWHMMAAPDERPTLDTEALARLAAALGRLADRDRRILAGRYGLDGGGPRRLHQVGADLGLSRERVRQLEDRALWRLRKLLGEDRP